MAWGAGSDLAPKAFDVLHYLVTHPNHLVIKDELLEAVWPETAITDAMVRVTIVTLHAVVEARRLTDTPEQVTGRAPVSAVTIPATLHEALMPGSTGWGAPKG